MRWHDNAQRQIRSVTVQKLQSALEKDGWVDENEALSKKRKNRGARIAYRHPTRQSNNRVVLHVHPKKTMGAKLLKSLLEEIGWTEDDMRRLKLIK